MDDIYRGNFVHSYPIRPNRSLINGGKRVKRTDYISWKEYFMGIAQLSAKRSKDPVTQVGACIVNDDNKIVGIGYNGFPNHCSDDDFPWDKSESYLESKKPYVVHAELNAILNSTMNLKGCTLYVTLFPCNECVKAIIQSGISKVYYLDDKNAHKEYAEASRKMLTAANIVFEKYEN